MNIEQTLLLLKAIDSWKTDPPDYKEIQSTTKFFMRTIFPNLPRDQLNYLAGNFIATHCNFNQGEMQ